MIVRQNTKTRGGKCPSCFWAGKESGVASQFPSAARSSVDFNHAAMRGNYIAYSPGFGSRCWHQVAEGTYRILSICAQERVEPTNTTGIQTLSVVLEDDQWFKEIPTKKNQGHARPTSKGSLRGHY